MRPRQNGTASSNLSSQHCCTTARLSVLICYFLAFIVAPPFKFSQCAAAGVGGGDNSRHSFSLTTFSPSGKLQQVEYATRAATTLGATVVAVVLDDDTVLFSSPHSMPSPLVRDDGTRRFCEICPGIAVAHSGISADGRAVVAAAQRLAVEHAYTFDEDIPIDIFLEEVSLLFQKYTMKPGARPFGCSLLVACLNNNGDDKKPAFYKIGPSGVVELMDRIVVLGAGGMGEESVNESLQEKHFWKLNVDEATAILNGLLTEKMEENNKKRDAGSEHVQKLAFIAGTFGRVNGLRTKIISHKS